MDDIERKKREIALRQLLDSPGGKILFEHIEEEIKEGWEKFIEMPVDQKTSKLAFSHQAKYQALKGIKEWILSEIKICE